MGHTMQQQIHEALRAAQTKLFPDFTGDFVVDYPTDRNANADYFSNVALVLSKAVGKSPREVAEQIVIALGTIEQVESVAVAGPGFLNFTVSRDFFRDKITTALQAGADWGRNSLYQGKKILIEKSAPNLYKPFHVGHLLNVSITESISRLNKISGAEVVDVSYPSDISLGVAKAVWSLIHNGGDATDIRALGDAYVAGTKAYDEIEDVQVAVKEINQNLNTTKTGEAWDIYQIGRQTSLDYFKKITTRLGSTFDDHFYESEAGVLGKEIVEAKVGDVFEESEGAIIFAGDKYGLHTRVFVTSNGLPVYEAKDIGLVQLKFERHNPDESILYTDVEQKQYFEVIKKAAELTFGEWGQRTHYLQHGRLRFADGKVSSRLGNVPLAEDLLEEVKIATKERIEEAGKVKSEDIEVLTEQIAIAALKYTFLKVALGQNITFDFSQALSFEGSSGPYLQYTYARIQSVLERAAAAGVVPTPAAAAPAQPYAVEKLIERFPYIITTALTERAPHHVVTYLTELAGAFNTFYAHEKIADPTDQYAPYKTAVAEAVAITLKNGLWVLGIEAPDKM